MAKIEYGKSRDVDREIENAALAKLRLARLTGTDAMLTTVEVEAVLSMLESG